MNLGLANNFLVFNLCAFILDIDLVSAYPTWFTYGDDTSCSFVDQSVSFVDQASLSGEGIVRKLVVEVMLVQALEVTYLGDTDLFLIDQYPLSWRGYCG